MGKFFAASRLNVRGAGGVVIGHNCRLKATDHCHVRRTSLSMEALLRPTPRLRTALQGLVRNPSDRSAVQSFQRALGKRPSHNPVHHRTQVVQPVATSADVSVADSDVVQIGNNTTLRHVTHYQVEEAVVQLPDLLRSDRILVEHLGTALGQPIQRNIAEFGRRLLALTGQARALQELTHVRPGDAPDTTIFHLFGDKTINNPAALMYGAGNSMESRSEFDLPAILPRTLVRGLEDLSGVHGLEPTPADSPVSAAPDVAGPAVTRGDSAPRALSDQHNALAAPTIPTESARLPLNTRGSLLAQPNQHPASRSSSWWRTFSKLWPRRRGVRW